MQKGVDYLPMAKPDANNHSGIRRDCVCLCKVCRLLVVLTEGRDLRLYETGRNGLKCARARYKVTLSLASGTEYALAERTPWL